MYQYNIYSLQFELPPVQPITVSIGVDIKDIPKVSDTDFAITLNAYFIVKWHDSRLIVEGRKETEDLFHVKYIYSFIPTNTF